MSPHHADHIRAKTAHYGVGVDRTVDFELCAGARIYSYCLSTEWAGEGDADPDVPLAVLHLQDSTLEVYPDSSVGADLPGLAWPAYAKLDIKAESRVTLHVTYGSCA
jgi:hypothetical protein